MDLSLPLIGILGVIGYNLNKPQNSRDYTDTRVKIPVSELSNGKTIYEAREFARIQKQEKQIHEKMRRNNALVSFNNKSDALASSKLRTAKIQQITEAPLNEYKGQQILPNLNKIFNGPMFNLEKYFVGQENTTDFNSKEQFQDISKLTGEKLESKHQNMQPFFGGKIKNADTSAVLNRYNGGGYYEKPKQEVEAVRNGPVNNVHGNVLFTDSIQQDRYVASTYQTALLPFEQVRVQPIPAEHNRGRQIGIDELRGDVNPKVVLEGRFTPGKTIDKRAQIGEVPDARISTTYELGPSKQFKTTGEDAGTYYQDTNHFRSNRKDITAEAQFNQNGAVNYREGAILRAGKNDDGRNTVVQDDKRGNWKGDWVRSRKAVSIDSNDIPTAENLNLRGQQREEGNRENMGNLTNKLAGVRGRFDESLKTTNKELSLYTYKGGSNGNGIKKASDRQAWYKNETKTKNTQEFIPGGKKANTPGVGVADFNFETKDRVNPGSYLGASSVYVQPSTNSVNFGDVTKNKFGGEDDFTKRLTAKTQDRSYDRPYGKFSNELKKKL